MRRVFCALAVAAAVAFSLVGMPVSDGLITAASESAFACVTRAGTLRYGTIRVGLTPTCYEAERVVSWAVSPDSPTVPESASACVTAGGRLRYGTIRVGFSPSCNEAERVVSWEISSGLPATTESVAACVTGGGRLRYGMMRVGFSPECNDGERVVSWATITTPTPTPTTPTTPTPPSTVVRPTGDPSGVSGLIFADEFNDSTIDREVWSPTWLKGDTGYSPPINGQESGCYHSGQASESDGALHLVAAATTSTLCRTRSGAVASIQSGIVTSASKLEFQNGYFEARIDMDAVNWPAWWTNGHHTDWPDRGELDVMELLSCREPAWHVHYTGTEAGSCEDRSVAGWHTYGMRWTPTRVDFFYDGVLVGGTSVSIPHDHYLVLNQAVRNSYTNGMVVGADMKVDYVRVWDLD